MKHLYLIWQKEGIMAGATGQGKSVGLNAFQHHSLLGI